MKKVLVIGYLLRPGGNYRIMPLVKRLPEFGWEPVVLTAPLATKPTFPLRVIETEYRDALAFWKRLIRYNPDEILKQQVKAKLRLSSSKPSAVDYLIHLLFALVSYPDSEKGWLPFGLKAGQELLRKEKIDAMISCPPVISHMIASRLKKDYDIPWVADFTDPWSQNRGYGYGYLNRLLYRGLEVRTISPANALVSISQPWAEKLVALHWGKSVHLIRHGFDPAAVNQPPARLTAKFTITYTGTIYTGNQDPTKLFQALRELITDGMVNPADIEVRFYGRRTVWLENEIRRYGLSDIAKYYGIVPRELALAKQNESQLLLVFDWEDPKETGIYTYKIFEYLGARRPILAAGGQKGSIAGELLRQTQAGIHAPTVADIKNTLQNWYQEYKLSGKVTYHGDEREINKYSHTEMARKFAEVLDHLTDRSDTQEVKDTNQPRARR